MDTEKHLLIADSDTAIAQHLAHLLSAGGYAVTDVHNGRAALLAFFCDHPSLVLLGSPLLGVDTLTVLRRIREASDTPVIVIAKTDRLAQRLRALQMAAQDFFSCSLDPEEIILRVATVLRRHAQQEYRPMVYDDGLLRVDTWRREVIIDSQPVHLTNAEMSLLACLVRQPGRVISYRHLYDALPWLGAEGSDAALNSVLHRLRRKLQNASLDRARIVSQRAVGIRLDTVGLKTGP